MVYKLLELSWIEVKNLLRDGIDTVILPVGVIEPHGVHLPLGTDALIPEALGEKVAERTNAILLPTIYYGTIKSLHGYPGSIRVEPEILENMIYQILKSMIFHGFRRIVILNGHGGSEQISAINNTAFRIWSEYKVPVIVIDWWILAREKGLTKEILDKEGGHAGSDETACIIARYPQLVKKDLYSDSEIVVYSRGTRTYPLIGTVINYNIEEGSVLFDENKARLFINRLIDLIVKEVQVFFEKVEKSIEK